MKCSSPRRQALRFSLETVCKKLILSGSGGTGRHTIYNRQFRRSRQPPESEANTFQFIHLRIGLTRRG